MDSSFNFILEHARSAGSRCKRCHAPIRRRELRIARWQISRSRRGRIPIWYHVACLYNLSPRPLRVSEISGLHRVGERARAEISALTYARGGEISDQRDSPKVLVDYATHYRCVCEVCNERIRKRELRMAVLEPRPHFPATLPKYFHAECFFREAQVPKYVREISDLPGFRQLMNQDKEFIQELIEVRRRGEEIGPHRLVPPWERFGSW